MTDKPDESIVPIVDVHTHFLPDNIERRVWAQFDEAGPKIGRPWPIRYRGTCSGMASFMRRRQRAWPHCA